MPEQFDTYQIGDRVRLTDNNPGNEMLSPGMTGTVIGVADDWSDDGDVYLEICWDDNIEGHSCSGKCENEHGWNLYGSSVMLIFDSGEDEISVEEEPSATDFFLS